MAHAFYLRFLHGDVGDPEHLLIMAATMSRWVHVETQISSVAFSAYHGVVPSFRATRADPPGPHWDPLRVPLTNRVLAMHFLHDMMRAELRYAMGWQCCLPPGIVQALESDLDCQRPETWGKVFCSQAILLWLRRCALSGILDTENDINLLWSVHSMACPPGRLRQVVRALFGPPDPPAEGKGGGLAPAADAATTRLARLRSSLGWGHPSPDGRALAAGVARSTLSCRLATPPCGAPAA